MIYLASPYSSPLPLVVEDRVQRTFNFALNLLQRGVPVFSPIVYCHPFAVMGKMPTDAGYWHQLNMQYLRKSEAVFVLRLQGWDQSKGVQAELRIAKILAMPIVHFDQDGQQLNTADDPTAPPPQPLDLSQLKKKQ